MCVYIYIYNIYIYMYRIRARSNGRRKAGNVMGNRCILHKLKGEEM